MKNIFERYVITFGWVGFLIVSILSETVGQIAIQHKYDDYIKQGYQSIVLLYDHIDNNENMLVYKYDVNGEIYTYNEELSNEKIPKKGQKLNCYYNPENPQELIKMDNGGIVRILAINLFLIACAILSIIDTKLGGTSFSWILLLLLFCTAGLWWIISVFINPVFLFEEPIAAIFLLLLPIMMICAPGYAVIVLLKESIEIIKNKSKK